MILVIGKRSNLSKKIFENFDDSVLISSSEIENNLDSILKYCKSDGINIIFNNFQPSTLLSDNKDFDKYITKSILDTSRVLSFLINHNIHINKLIYTSSSSVYGNNKFCSEDDQVKPMSLQGALKVSNEELIKRICDEYKINYTVARVFNMYGGDDKFSVVSKLKDSYINLNKLNVINEGKAIRDYIYIDDVVSVYSTLINKTLELPKILNIASGKGIRIVDLLHFIESKGFSIKTNNIKRNEINASIADVTLLSELIDIENFIDVKNFLLAEIRNK